MAEINEELVRERAYFIWEREGRPEGRQTEHWEAALRELTIELNLSNNDGRENSENGRNNQESRTSASSRPSPRRRIKSIVAKAKDALNGIGAAAETVQPAEPKRKRAARSDPAARSPKKP